MSTYSTLPAEDRAIIVMLTIGIASILFGYSCVTYDNAPIGVGAAIIVVGVLCEYLALKLILNRNK